MPRPRVDIAGIRIGMTLVASPGSVRTGPSGNQRFFWICKCDCGKEFEVDGCVLRRGSPFSCGCVRKSKHGLTDHYIYTLWLGIKQRCNNPKSECFKDYGGRGIKMCDRWLESVTNFYLDMGDRPTPRHTIERVNNAVGYQPGNCKWATRAEQNENTRQTAQQAPDRR